VTLNELKSLLKASTKANQTIQGAIFQEVRSRKRHSTAEAARSPKKAAVPTPVQVPTKNFFAPLRTAQLDTDASDAQPSAEEAAAPAKTAMPPPIVLTSAGKLIQLQKELKGVARQIFELRNTKSGTRIVTKDMVDYQAVKALFIENSLAFFTFFPKSEKPVKAVLRHLPSNTPAKDISNGLVDLGFDVVSVNQMSSARRSPDGSHPITLPLFLVTLPRTQKSHEIFKLSSLCHICIKVEAYKSQSSLTQCYNCQQFGHVWANCKQPPRCLCCGGGHLHKDFPEKGKASSTPACCNCQLAEGVKPHPANYRGCKHAKDEMRKKKPHATPKPMAGRVFSFNSFKPHLSFAAALRGQSNKKPREEEPAAMNSKPAATKLNVQETGRSVQAQVVNSDSLEMFRALSEVQQIMAELKGSASEEDKFVSVAKTIFNLMKENGK
jgi:hypothetical protein